MKKMKKIEPKMTVGKLKEILALYSDDTPVGRAGHFGEFVDISYAGISKVFISDEDKYKGERIDIFEIYPYDLGEEPD